MAARTLPPKRPIPPPLPTRRTAMPIQLEQVVEDVNAPQIFSNSTPTTSLQPSYCSNGQEPPIAEPTSPQMGHSRTAFALLLAGLDPDYFSWLLARPPPPIPNTQTQASGGRALQLPPRRRAPQRPPPQVNDSPGLKDSTGTHRHRVQQGSSRHEHEPGTNVSLGGPSPGGLYTESTCIRCHDFSQVDAHAIQFPRQQVRSLESLAENLTRSFKYETEKARAIFTWMHHNIRYDTQSFFAGTVKPATPESTLSSGLAVCEGFAGLFVCLAEQAGLHAYQVSGHGKGFGYQELPSGAPIPDMSHNHAWNCVFMDGEWRLIDVTWGAGAVNGSSYEQRFDASWFSSTPTEFGRRHFPADPTFQLIPEEEGGPINWKQYILHPQGPLIYKDFYQLDLFLDLLQPASNAVENGRMVTFILFKRCEHMSTSEVDNYVFILHSLDQRPLPLLLNSEGGWSITHHISSQAEVSLLFVATVDGRDARGLGVKGFYNALDRKPMTFGGLVKWAVT